jgi:glycosyltransferase involved in cell wall biosynthesis
MDVFAFPSFREGCGIVVLEASAAGLPIAAFRATGVVDGVVDGVTGTLTPSGDAESLAAAIVRYLKKPELRSRHGQAGCERVSRDYRPDAVRETHYQEYVSLLQEAGVSQPNEESAMAEETAVPQVT